MKNVVFSIKKLYAIIIALFISVFAIVQGQVDNIIISKLCDPYNNYQTNRFIELYNAGDNPVYLPDWTLVAIGNGLEIYSWPLQGDILPGAAITVGDPDNTNFLPDITIGYGPDQSPGNWSDFNYTWNGSTGDGAILNNNIKAIIDDAGSHGNFGNKVSERIPSVGIPVTVFNPTEWESASVDDAIDALPGFHPCEFPDNQYPVIVEVTQEPAEPTSLDGVTISAVLMDDGGINQAYVDWSLSGGKLTINMTNGGSGDLYTTETPIPAQTIDATVQYYVIVTDAEGLSAYEFGSYTVVPLVPEFTDMEWEISSDNQQTWQTMGGSLENGFDFGVDANNEFDYFLGLSGNTTTNSDLDDGLYEFRITGYPNGFFEYWAEMGVYAGATGEWEQTAWAVINGNAAAFYVKAENGKSALSIVDGIEWQVNATEIPWKIYKDYPAGNYSCRGIVTGAGVDSDTIDINMEVRDETPGMAWYSNIFFEHPDNNGSIDNTIDLELEYETFTVSDAEMTINTHFTAGNVPPGLTVTLVGTTDTTAYIEITGNADQHEDVNDINNLEIVFLDDAFSGGNAAGVIDFEKYNLEIDFMDNNWVDLEVWDPEGGDYYYCELTGDETIDMEIMNVGNITILTGEKIYGYYRINSGALVKDSVTLAADLLTGESVTLTFDETYDFSAIQLYEIKVWIYFEVDLVPGNDTITEFIDHIELTVEIAGGDTINVEAADFPVTLNTVDTYEDYFWSDAGGTETGTDATFAATAFGWYYVTVSDFVDCEAVDSLYVDGAVGIEDITDEAGMQILVYPNPNTGRFTIGIITNTDSDIYVELFNLSGQIVYSRKDRIYGVSSETIDISGFARGVYIVKVVAGNEMKTEKLVVK